MDVEVDVDDDTLVDDGFEVVIITSGTVKFREDVKLCEDVGNDCWAGLGRAEVICDGIPLDFVFGRCVVLLTSA